jgi:hypothetical protein
MTTTDHDGRRHLELVGPLDDNPTAELVQPAPADGPEQVDQDTAVEPSPGAELVPLDQAGELVERPWAEPPAVVEGPVLDGRRPPAPRRPILPAWLRSWDTFCAAAVWAAARSAHLTAFHALRLPLYWLKLVGRSPVGLGRSLAWWSAGCPTRRGGRYGRTWPRGRGLRRTRSTG